MKKGRKIKERERETEVRDDHLKTTVTWTGRFRVVARLSIASREGRMRMELNYGNQSNRAYDAKRVG